MADSVALEDDETGTMTRALVHADLEIRGDGRTVYGLVVPFNREAVINTRGGNYREVFRPGSFKQTINSGVSRVKLFENHGHLRGDAPIGVASMLREDAKGVVGEFRIGATPDGDHALQKIHDGVYDAFSIGFSDVPGKSIKSKDLVERTEVRLKEVSLVWYPAYGDAAISGVRNMYPELTPDVLERLLALTPDVIDRILGLATDLDTRNDEAARSTSVVVEQSRQENEQDISHSSQEPASAVDTSPAARAHRARLIEARRKSFGKRA